MTAALRWTLVAGLACIPAAALAGRISPLTAFVLIVAAGVLCGVGLMAVGMAQEAAYRHDRPVEQYLHRLADGGPLDAAQREELLAGESALETPATLKSIDRARREGRLS